MGWLPQSDFNNARSRVLKLSKEDRLALTWEEAGRFVLFDTLHLARWAGLKASGLTPWEALCRLHRIRNEDSEPTS